MARNCNRENLPYAPLNYRYAVAPKSDLASAVNDPLGVADQQLEVLTPQLFLYLVACAPYQLYRIRVDVHSPAHGEADGAARQSPQIDSFLLLLQVLALADVLVLVDLYVWAADSRRDVLGVLGH